MYINFHSLDDVMDGLKFTVKIEEGRVGGKDPDKGELIIDFKGDGFVVQCHMVYICRFFC